MLKKASLFFKLAIILFLSSCSGRMGYGVLLWSTEEPVIHSGTVLPVYLRSTIEQVWVVGIPKELIYDKDDPDKMEIPLTQLEFLGSRRKAENWAESFAEHALLYAENLQDGLPIRDAPDNSSRRVYRLRGGEIIKLISSAKGNPPIGASGDPLPGEWYRVLTLEGVTGYCFSNRLRIFEHYEGEIPSAQTVMQEAQDDSDLEIILTRRWSPELYLTMVTSRQINISELEKRYRFDPGLNRDTAQGLARIIHPEVNREFRYEGITSLGDRLWRFDGTSLEMHLRSNTSLSVQFTDDNDLRCSLLFVSLAANIDDLILQETARREAQYADIYNQGPVFTSNNYGTIRFNQNQNFTWTGYDLLVPQLIPENISGEGRVLMDLFITPSFTERYEGAFSLRFRDTQNTVIRFMYSLDNQGIRLEAVPDYAVEDITVTRRSSSPMVLYFFKDSSN